MTLGVLSSSGPVSHEAVAVPRSAPALQKISRRTLSDGTTVHSFQTLLQELSTIVRNTCRTRGESRPASPTFQMITTPNAIQRRAIELLQALSV